MSVYDKEKGDDVVAWSYNGLWKLLIDKKMKKTDLLTVAGLNPKTMDALGKLCTALDCRIEDIVEFVPVETPKK